MKEKSYSVNGINLYSFTNPNLRSFCVSLYIRFGSMFEEACENGISHLFEHIVFRNIKSKYECFYDLLTSCGLNFQGCTYKEFMRFSITGPIYSFDFASDIICSIFDEIKLSSLEFNNEKKRIKAEIREKDEKSSLDYYFSRLVWYDTEAEKTVLGYCKTIDNTSIKKINSFRRKILSKGNCFIYVTGNVSQNDIDNLVEKVSVIDISPDKAGFNNFITVSDGFFNRDGIPKVKDNSWNYVKIGFDVDCTKFSGGVFDVLYSVLFKGDTALVHNYLSEDNPVIYSFDSTFEQYDNIGNLNFKFEVDSDKLLDSVKLIIEVINAVKSGKFNFDANLRSEMITAEMEFDKPDDLNWSMAYYNHILNTDRIDYSDELYGRFRGVTKELVMEAAEEIFRKSNMTVAIKGDKKKINVNDIIDVLNVFEYLF